ncbi:glycoside hydrolase family 16 protein [Prolixibacteraceae bacterium JC049]|nr:glycoside hydrolase family 16 protein [Prolixibacteraceae bacterium JC049]
MRHLLLIAIALVAIITSCQAQETSKKLIWADEFNKDGLPDSKSWTYEVGYIRNKEKQYYTEKRLDNVRIENGHLIIESKKEDYKNFGYTSGSINTFGRVSFKGDFRIEVRAKLPKGKGIWPAIWMMGTNRSKYGWPKCSELDIMEFVGKDPNIVYGTMHWADSRVNYKHKSKGGKIKITDLHTNFHVYGLERKGSHIKVFIDDEFYFEFDVPKTAFEGSFTSPVYLLLNTAVGGSWGGPIDDSIFPQKFVIDYVRAYKL